MTSKHEKSVRKTRQHTGADRFWGVLAYILVQQNEQGKNPAARDDSYLLKLKEEIEKGLKKEVKVVKQAATEQLIASGKDKDARKRARAGENLQFREAKIVLNQFFNNAKRVPEEERHAFWDGVLWWAKSVIDKPLSGIAAPSKVWQIPSSKELKAIREYALDADWVRTPSQQILLNLCNSLARGEFKQDPLVSNYPLADISADQWQAHAEIRPLDYEREIGGVTVPSDELEKTMNKLADTFKRSGVEVDNTSKIVLSLWDKKKDRDSWAYITLDDICRELGIKERNNHGGFEPRKRDAIRKAAESCTGLYNCPRPSIKPRDKGKEDASSRPLLAYQKPIHCTEGTLGSK